MARPIPQESSMSKANVKQADGRDEDGESALTARNSTVASPEGYAGAVLPETWAGSAPKDLLLKLVDKSLAEWTRRDCECALVLIERRTLVMPVPDALSEPITDVEFTKAALLRIRVAALAYLADPTAAIKSLEQRSDLQSDDRPLAPLGRDRIVYSRTTAAPFRPSVFIVLVPEQKIIAVCVRGSAEIDDWITDLCAEPQHVTGIELDGQILDGYVHQGMYHSAVNLYEELEGKLRKLLDANPDYTVEVIGHSLGAGTSALLAMVLRSRNVPRIEAWVYAPPPVMSMPLATACEPFINAFVLADDMVPRLSLTNLHVLRMQLVFAQALCGASNDTIDSVLNKFREHVLDGETDPFMEYRMACSKLFIDGLRSEKAEFYKPSLAKAIMPVLARSMEAPSTEASGGGGDTARTGRSALPRSVNVTVSADAPAVRDSVAKAAAEKKSKLSKVLRPFGKAAKAVGRSLPGGAARADKGRRQHRRVGEMWHALANEREFVGMEREKQLCVPGVVFHIALEAPSGIAISNERRATKLLHVDRRVYTQIPLSMSMFKHHLTDRYKMALKQLYAAALKAQGTAPPSSRGPPEVFRSLVSPSSRSKREPSSSVSSKSPATAARGSVHGAGGARPFDGFGSLPAPASARIDMAGPVSDSSSVGESARDAARADPHSLNLSLAPPESVDSIRDLCLPVDISEPCVDQLDEIVTLRAVAESLTEEDSGVAVLASGGMPMPTSAIVVLDLSSDESMSAQRDTCLVNAGAVKVMTTGTVYGASMLDIVDKEADASVYPTAVAVQPPTHHWFASLCRCLPIS